MSGRRRRGTGLPQGHRDLYLEQAVTRALQAALGDRARRLHVLVLAGVAWVRGSVGCYADKERLRDALRREGLPDAVDATRVIPGGSGPPAHGGGR